VPDSGLHAAERVRDVCDGAETEGSFAARQDHGSSRQVSGMRGLPGTIPHERASCPLSARRIYFLGLQPGWLHAQGSLPSAQEVEQYFFPFTSTVASLQEQAPLLHPVFAFFSIAAISTSTRRSVSGIYPHGACHGGGSAIVNAP
jgi:hypothetical protein